jgi:histone H3/H4
MSDILVIASKIKKYIKDKKGMNTSASVMEKITEIVEEECNKAMERAEKAKRKTVMDRDFEE